METYINILKIEFLDCELFYISTSNNLNSWSSWTNYTAENLRDLKNEIKQSFLNPIICNCWTDKINNYIDNEYNNYINNPNYNI